MAGSATENAPRTSSDGRTHTQFVIIYKMWEGGVKQVDSTCTKTTTTSQPFVGGFESLRFLNLEDNLFDNCNEIVKLSQLQRLHFIPFKMWFWFWRTQKNLIIFFLIQLDFNPIRLVPSKYSSLLEFWSFK